jgi:predicted lipid-binding transport protein (Tim44 family)
MKPYSTPPKDPKIVDPDIAEQAVPGHGVPSQDPEAAAQVGLSPEEAARESKSALIGGGLVAGLATGAAVGAVVAGPVGILAGGTIGAVAGVVGSNVAGEAVKKKSTSNPARKPKDAGAV